MVQIGVFCLKKAGKKGKKMVGIERFDKERSDEEPCRRRGNCLKDLSARPGMSA